MLTFNTYILSILINVYNSNQIYDHFFNVFLLILILKQYMKKLTYQVLEQDLN